MKSLYRQLSSIKLTIVLTYLIVSVTVTGSFALLSNKEDFEAIDESLLIDWVWATPLSSAWWIILLVLLVFIFSLNTIVCTFDRLSSLFKVWSKGRKAENDEEETLVTQEISRGKGVRIRTLLPYIAHAGFLIALAAHLTGSIWGFRGDDFAAAQGDEVEIKELAGFSVKVGDLDMVVGKRGYPETMWGDVSLLGGGKEIKRQRVEINSPLIYKDIAVYIKNVQSVPKGIVLKKSDKEGEGTFLLAQGESVHLGSGELRLVGGRMDSRYGAMELIFIEKGKIVEKRWISPYNQRFKLIKFRDIHLSAEDIKSAPVGSFSVNRDPGARILFLGLFIFAASLVAHLFFRRSK
ncbi:MAG: cytochrome c biogenesis protein ResB [bacterium]|nr:cytochrome c biogenesis protein ResB [bacterium]